jgi:CRISPR/Cas system endoribonuclease Cas6 (RAMP superfamily)
MLPEGCTVKVGIEVIAGEISEAVLRDLLDFGYYNGIGQWRGGGWGKFRYELVKED